MSKKLRYFSHLGADTPGGAMETRLIRHLPEPLRSIGEIGGLQTAVAIAEAKGGSEVWFPGKRRHADSDSWLLDIVDEELAGKLCDEIFPIGEWVLIPMAPFIVRVVRVKEWTLAGMGVGEMARRLRCHRRTIVRVRAWLRSEGQLPASLGCASSTNEEPTPTD